MENGSHSVGTPSVEKPGTPGPGPASPRSPSHNTTAGTNHTLHVYTDSDINLDPFADTNSVHSGSSSHIIPIAYVPSSSASMSLADGHRQSTQPSLNSSNFQLPPSRPFRSPELNLRLEQPKSAASRLSTGASDLRPPRFSSPYAGSQRSGVSRVSTISSVGSFIYGDTPVVVSQAQGGVRQVLGVARPEVVQVPTGGLTTPTTPGSGTGAELMRSWSTRSKKSDTVPPVPALPPTATLERSPFSPDSDFGSDPFADREDPVATGSVRSLNTFGKPAIPGLRASKSPTQTPTAYTFLAEPVGYDSRPSSIGTFAGASVESAQRVMLGGTAAASTEDLDARVPPPPPEHASRASVADSILSAFPFVPPSPIAQGDESTQFRPSSLAMSISDSVVEPANHPQAAAGVVPTLSELAREEEEALAEYGQAARLPSRHTLGMSTFSSASGISSSGLEAFPFHFGGTGGAARDSIDTNPDELGAMGPSVNVGSKGATRASLDTLALSRDLEAFPLPNDVYKR